MKTRPVGAELFHADGQTDGPKDRHDEAFRNFSNAPKNRQPICQHNIRVYGELTNHLLY